MHPQLHDLYAGAAERGFPTSLLGNPAPRERVEDLIEIQHPRYFQISLEGLREHNDEIRGEGSFDRALTFLAVLRELRVPSTVMLTLTKRNMGQVLPLAELLRDRTDYFTFNRLSPVGEGAQLLMPAPDEYAAFVAEYLDAARENPVMGLKDNLINVELHKRGLDLFGGCTGFGCGAAFNFFALLADGEVHACRKFPSLLGNAYEQSLAEIYDSDLAARYRAGSAACAACELRPVCGGCMAAVNGSGMDIFTDRDPLCMLQARPA
jgi:selenobiotic family peptide radical SAM maturase